MPGQAARNAAIDAVARCLGDLLPLDGLIDRACRRFEVAGRDRALVRAVTGTTLRRLGQIDPMLAQLMDRPLPDKAAHASACLRVGMAQIMFMGVADHAAVSTAVNAAGSERPSRPYKKLVNGVLREAIRRRDALREGAPDDLCCPDWLRRRWEQAYGAETVTAIIQAHLQDPSLDLTIRGDRDEWVGRFDGLAVGPATVRIAAQGRIEDLPGYDDGAWWVQDAAATLPARLLGDVKGRHVADLCAAPGGKTAQLAAAGADVTAVDRSGSRIQILESNLARLGLGAELVTADLLTWAPGRQFDALLLDAPCTATGTIRRHPEIAWLRRPADIASLADLQGRMLARTADWLRPGGLLVYAACSLEPEEGERQIERLLAADPRYQRVPITADELGDCGAAATGTGDLRSLPCHLRNSDPRLSGLDGFFAARLRFDG